MTNAPSSWCLQHNPRRSLNGSVGNSSLCLRSSFAFGFPQCILDALDCVTKRKGEDYEAFIARPASNPAGRRVKLADPEDNMDIRRSPQIAERDRKRLNKSLRAYRWLSIR